MQLKAPLVLASILEVGLNGHSNPAIIFDLGGVLVNEAETQLEVKIYHRLFAFLHYLNPTIDYKRAYLLSTMSGQIMHDIIQANIDNPTHTAFFTNEQERYAIKMGAAHILVPAVEISHTILQDDAFAFVQQCKANNIRLLILSNWQVEAFTLLRHKYPALFALFQEQDIFIPAGTGLIKPDKAVYEYVIKVANVTPNTTFFIDDSQKNVAPANECGLIGIVHNDWHSTKQAVETHLLAMQPDQKGLPL